MQFKKVAFAGRFLQDFKNVSCVRTGWKIIAIVHRWHREVTVSEGSIV